MEKTGVEMTWWENTQGGKGPGVKDRGRKDQLGKKTGGKRPERKVPVTERKVESYGESQVLLGFSYMERISNEQMTEVKNGFHGGVNKTETV